MFHKLNNLVSVVIFYHELIEFFVFRIYIFIDHRLNRFNGFLLRIVFDYIWITATKAAVRQ